MCINSESFRYPSGGTSGVRENRALIFSPRGGEVCRGRWGEKFSHFRVMKKNVAAAAAARGDRAHNRCTSR